MNKHLRRTFTRQIDQSDCGVAALLSVLRFHGGDAQRERLRDLSGTSQSGTTLLGIFQAAQNLGFTARAMQADSVQNLIEYVQSNNAPCILHIVKDERLQHYIVCYGMEHGRFVVGDPASGFTNLMPAELEAVWQSKALLTLAPNERFQRAASLEREKRRWMRELIEPDVTMLAVALALGVVIALLSLSTAIFSQKLVDVLLPKGDTVRLGVGLALLVVLLVARAALNFLRGRFVLAQSRAFNSRVVQRFYAALLHLPQSFFDNRKTGDLVARMNDAHRLQQALSYLAGEVMIDALLFVVALAVIALYSWPIAVFVLASVMVYFFWAWRFHTPIVQAQQAVMAAYGMNESNYVDTIQGIAAIKAAGKEEHFSSLTRLVYGAFQEKMFALGSIGTRFSFAVELTSVAILAVVIVWSSLLVLQGALLLGALVALVQMVGQISGVSVRLAVTNIRLQEARIAFERMYAFAATEPEFTADSESANHELHHFDSLCLEDVTFRFAGRPALLQNASLKVRRGEIVALMGESGSGKTSLMQMLQRFYAPECGRITVNGAVALQDVSVRSWRRIIGVVPQHVKIFNSSVMSNICLMSADAAGDAEEIAQSVMNCCREYGLERFILQLPQGYATMVGEEGVNLSGGQRQIIALARALYHRPQLLLLDEATSALDKHSEAQILELFLHLKQTMGIVMVTHREHSTAIADRVYEVRSSLVQEMVTL
jgi:ATP-binding cassette subfamily B protein